MLRNNLNLLKHYQSRDMRDCDLHIICGVMGAVVGKLLISLALLLLKCYANWVNAIRTSFFENIWKKEQCRDFYSILWWEEGPPPLQYIALNENRRLGSLYENLYDKDAKVIQDFVTSSLLKKEKDLDNSTLLECGHCKNVCYCSKLTKV